MNKEIFKGQWHELKGKVKQHWGKLTDDEIMKVEGKAEELTGLIQKKYGFTKEKAEQAVDDFVKESQKEKK